MSELNQGRMNDNQLIFVNLKTVKSIPSVSTDFIPELFLLFQYHFFHFDSSLLLVLLFISQKNNRIEVT